MCEKHGALTLPSIVTFSAFLFTLYFRDDTAINQNPNQCNTYSSIYLRIQTKRDRGKHVPYIRSQSKDHSCVNANSKYHANWWIRYSVTNNHLKITENAGKENSGSSSIWRQQHWGRSMGNVAVVAAVVRYDVLRAPRRLFSSPSGTTL